MNTDFIYFLKLVSEMPEYQKQYFRTRNTATLNTSKKLEKDVDDYVKMMLYKNTNVEEDIIVQQTKLFGDGN